MRVAVSRAPGAERAVTPLELFFDLVYVFAIGQLSHHLLGQVDLRTGAETVVMTLAVIYAWYMTAWGVNWLEPDRLPVRVLLVGLMFASLLMSVAIPDAFDGRAWLFVTGYLLLQVGRAGFLIVALRGRPQGEHFVNVLVWELLSGSLWVAGAIADPDARLMLWGLAVVAADSYAALETEGNQWPRMRWLNKLLERVEPDAKVLDVGCGNGVPATRAIADGHRAVGVDVSAAQIERAERNVPNAEFIRADLSELEFVERFSAITAFYVIEHLPRERHDQVFERFHDWLLPGGYLLFTIEPEDEPGVVGKWLGEPMFFSQFSAARTLEILGEAGFRTLETAIEDQLEGARKVSYLWVLAQRT